MIDRYAAPAFRRYCAVRGLSPVQARIELALFDPVVRPARTSAGKRRLVVSPPADQPSVESDSVSRKEHASWTT